ncbi:MAG: SPOR domain-containing protein [Marinicella pacifica]
MDQELKQRLIGASVIIALAIIFIPMLFDNEVKKSDDKNIDIVIPESGSHPLTVKKFSLEDGPEQTDLNSVTIPKSDFSLADDRVVEQETVQGNGLIEKSTVTDGLSNRDMSQQIRETDPVNNEAAPDNTAKNSAEDNKPVAQTEKNQTQNSDNADKNPSEMKVTDAQKNIYRVKLGSFSKAENAQKVKNQLAQQNIGSLVEPATDRALYRVWSDVLYRDKAKAESYVAAVKKLKLNIGTPKIISVTEDEIKAVADRGQLGWVVQLGSFAAKNNALDLRQKLRLAGFTAFVDETSNSQGEARYRLRVGPVNSRDQAEELKQQISDKLPLKGLVKTHELARLVD